MYKYLIMALLLVPTNAPADQVWQAILTVCNEDEFTIRGYTEYEPPRIMDKETQSFHDTGVFRTECKVGKYHIVANVSNHEAKEKGACGSAPGSTITIKIDGKAFIEDARMNVECINSLRSVAFQQSKRQGFLFMFCARPGGEPIKFDGCIEMDEKSFGELPFPMEREFYRKPFAANPWKRQPR